MILLITTFDPARIPRLPQVVGHYRALGVQRFLLSLQTEPGLPGAEARRHRARFEAALSEAGLSEAFFLEAGFTGMAVRRHHDALQRDHAGPEDWIVWCDSDELQVYPESLVRMAELAQADGVDFLRGALIDRLAADGGLPPFDPRTPLWETFPRTVFLSPAIGGGERHKVAFARGDVRVSGGNHFAMDAASLSTWTTWVQVHHFKWDAEVLARLRFRLDPAFREQCPWWVESQRMLDYFEAHGLRFDPADLQELHLQTTELLTIEGF